MTLYQLKSQNTTMELFIVNAGKPRKRRKGSDVASGGKGRRLTVTGMTGRRGKGQRVMTTEERGRAVMAEAI